MQKLFSHIFSAHIWRILPHPDPERNEWALELREISEKKVSFALIDLDERHVRWQKTPPDADWWTSITGLAHDQVFLHHYRYPDLPEPTDLAALSIKDGELRWVLPNYVLVKALDYGNIEVASKGHEGFNYAVYSAETGRINPSPVLNDVATEIILKQPVRYKEGNVYFGKLASFLQTILNIKNPVCIDYLDHRPYMMFSYYIYQQDQIVQYLLIVNDQKQVVLHEQLSEGRDGIGQSTILLKNSTLVYLKDSSEFSSLKLS